MIMIMIMISKADARDLGLIKFTVAKPCERCGCQDRYVSSGGCVGCVTSKAAAHQRSPGGKAYNMARYRRPAVKARALRAATKSRPGIDERDLPLPLVAGHCDLCGKPSAPLCWDHDHDLEELGFPMMETHRGWLCIPCNTGLGKLGDNRLGLLEALSYIRRAAQWPRR